MGKTLIMFLVNGTSVKFSNVTNFEAHVGSSLITFTYVSVSDKETRAALFDSNSFVGYSVSVTPEPKETSGFDNYIKGDK